MLKGKQSSYTDEWGIGWRSIEYKTKFGTGRYTEIAHHPLAEDHAIASYTPPDPGRDKLYREAGWTLDTFRDEYWIVGVTVTTVFETAWALRGLQKLLMDFVVDPELADRILDISYQYHFTAAKRLVQMGVDMIWIGDDVGGQHGMDPKKLKDEYGDSLCFWGSIDEQQTLPFGSPEGVRQEVLTRLQTLGRGGGLILGPTHHVQLDTPMDNFWAMTDTIRETAYA